jgi:predicted type IV restriction endonuclease
MEDNAIPKIQNIDLKDVWQGKKTGVEENVKLKIVLPLLRYLGYDDVTDMDFEHFVENKRADIAILINGKPKIVVECKSLEKNLDDAISQALNYANKQQIPYILLTNGKEFRLYKPFIENLVNPKDRLLTSAHLETLIHDIEELQDWISKESLTKNKIDKKAQRVEAILREEITPKMLTENLKNAKKILTEDAKSKILPAIQKDMEFRKLVDDWIKNSELDSTKTEQWVDILANEIAYSFINKLYFYRIAEDRGIVKPKLNKHAMGQLTQYMEYNDLLKMAFAEILRIDYEAIFKHDVFDKIDFSEGHLKRIIDDLSEYNFAKIGSDIIGRIYEDHVSRDERKKLGQFYTPDYIIDYILNNIPIKVNYKLLDPACGSGGFLIRAYDRFLKISIDKNKSNSHKQILENNLYGYDINPFAVHLTAMNLALKNIESKTDVLNVVERDSLLTNNTITNSFQVKTLDAKVKEADKAKHSGFNAVVGNPPYFNMKQEDIEKKYKGQGYDSISTGVTNIASLFLKRYIELLEPSGYLGFVVPKSITYLDSWKGIRKVILQETEIVKIFDVHEAFDGVLLEQIAIVLQKKPATKHDLIEVQYIELPYTRKKIGKHIVKSELFTEEIFPLYQFNDNAKIFSKMKENSKLLSEISQPIFRGVTIQKYEYLFTDKPSSNNDLAILRGVNIDQYAFKDKIQYVDWQRAEFKSYKKQLERLLKPKIMGQRLIAQTSNHMKLIATIDKKGECLEVDTVNNVVLNDDSFDLRYILGIINSKLASYFIYNFVFNRAVRTVDFKYVSELPIKLASTSKREKLIELVDKVLKEDADSKEAEELRAKIDKEVYDIYELTLMDNGTMLTHLSKCPWASRQLHVFGKNLLSVAVELHV